MAESLNGGIMVLAGNSAMQRSNDAAFQFEQEANFWYYTGIDEAGWWLIADFSRQKYWLVEPEIDEVHRIFEGGLSAGDARAQSGCDAVITRDEAMTLLRDLARKHSVVRTLGDHPLKEHLNFVENPAQKKLSTTLSRVFSSALDCRKEIAQLRAIKQPEEIAAIKKAIKITIEAFEHVKSSMHKFGFEYEVEAEFDYHFRKNNLNHGYDPIVAGGARACTLHYSKNSQKLKKSDLLLMDIGARSGGYSADITRTFAAGKPTKRQSEVHGAVESAHKKIISLLRPGLSVLDYQKSVDKIMKQALMEIGLIDNADDERYRYYFPHAVSHGLGVDVHDSLGGADSFQEGMVLTVEPGIYIPEESIGVRIEDDILVTKTGHTNLSARLSTDLT